MKRARDERARFSFRGVPDIFKTAGNASCAAKIRVRAEKPAVALAEGRLVERSFVAVFR